MHHPIPTAQLARLGEWRSITRLNNSHIELCWDWIIIHLRSADLLVLHARLETWRDEAEEAPAYMLCLGGERLSLLAADLEELAELVGTAVAHLPRRVVHWVDHEMSILPLHPHVHNGPSQFSLN